MTDGRSATDVRLEHLERDFAELKRDFKEYREHTETEFKAHKAQNEREMKALTRFQVWLMGIFAGATPVTVVLLKKLGIIS